MGPGGSYDRVGHNRYTFTGENNAYCKIKKHTNNKIEARKGLGGYGG